MGGGCVVGVVVGVGWLGLGGVVALAWGIDRREEGVDGWL